MICRICGTTSGQTRDWRPNCPKHGGDVCGSCCMSCEDHISWSGIWRCAHITEQRRRELSVARAKAAEQEEIRRISDAYHRDRKAKAREHYMKIAMQRKRKETQSIGRAERAAAKE